MNLIVEVELQNKRMPTTLLSENFEHSEKFKTVKYTGRYVMGSESMGSVWEENVEQHGKVSSSLQNVKTIQTKH